MTELYLIRHGETDWNRQRRVQGRTDIPLNEMGREQARRAGDLLARRTWTAVYSSPLSRARETAELIAARVGLEAVVALDELMERDYGAAEGLTDREIEERYPGGLRAPGQETREEVGARIVAALDRIAREHPGGRVLVVSHGGAIRSVLNAVDPETRHPAITNASVHSFRHTEEGIHLVAFDDPIEEESIDPSAEDIDDQNAVEAQDDQEGAAL